MDFEIEIRLEEELSQEQQDYIRAMKKIDDEFDATLYAAQNVEYRYVPITIDMRAVGPYNYYDEEHTIIRINNSSSAFMARIPYQTFQGIREAMMGTATKKMGDFHIKTRPNPGSGTKTKP